MRLLQIEFLKLGRLANYILLGLLLFFIIALVGTIFYNIKSDGLVDLNNVLIIQVIGGVQSLSSLLFSIFIVINIGKEFSEATLRRSVIDGYTRDEFFQGKLILLILSSIVVYGLYLLAMIIGGLSIGKLDMVWKFFTLSSLINPFVNIITAGVFVFFLTMVTRSVTISLVLYFVWAIAEGMLIGLHQLMSKLKDWHFELADYLPLSSMHKVLTSTEIIETKTIAIALTYVLVMLLLSYWSFTKRDIK